jgi:hypothetical protein
MISHIRFVSIKVYEGTSREQVYWYRGNLAASNPDNNRPDGTGADWVDIAEITLTQSTTRAARASRLANGNINITAPVPPIDQRLKAKAP